MRLPSCNCQRSFIFLVKIPCSFFFVVAVFVTKYCLQITSWARGGGGSRNSVEMLFLWKMHKQWRWWVQAAEGQGLSGVLWKCCSITCWNAPPSLPLQERMGGAASRAIHDFVLEWNSQSPRKQDHEFVPTASTPKHCQSSEVCDSFYSFPFPTNCSAWDSKPLFVLTAQWNFWL